MWCIGGQPHHGLPDQAYSCQLGAHKLAESYEWSCLHALYLQLVITILVTTLFASLASFLLLSFDSFDALGFNYPFSFPSFGTISFPNFSTIGCPLQCLSASTCRRSVERASSLEEELSLLDTSLLLTGLLELFISLEESSPSYKLPPPY